METQTHLCLYGGPVLATPGGRTSFSPIQACLLALAYVEPEGTLTRERISWLLWDEGDGDRQRHRIRQLVYQINERAGLPVVQRDGDTVVPLIPSDTREEMPSDLAPLARITSPPTASFDHWLDGAIKTMEQARTERLAEILDRAANRLDFEEVKRAASRLTRLGVGGVGPVLDLAWALQRGGEWRQAEVLLTDAVELYRDSAVARRRLESALTAVRNGQAMEEEVHRPPTPEALIGREEIWSKLRRYIDDPAIEFVLVAGPQGIGKSALLSEVEREYSVRFPTHSVLSSPAGARRRRRVFRLCELWLMNRRVLAFLSAHPDLFTPALRRAFPSISAQLGFMSPPPAPEDHPPSLLGSDFSALLNSLSGGGPVMLLADDLELSDQASRELLLTAAEAGDVAFKLVASVTADGLAHARLITDRMLPSAANLRLLYVPELEDEAAVQLVMRWSPERISRGRAEQIFSALGGIPGYLVEAAANPGQAAAPLPNDARELLENRVAHLSSLERHICSTVAVAGVDLPPELLAKVAGVSPARAVLAVERLVGQGLLERRTDGVGFRHSFMATGMYQRLSAGEQRALHGEVLTAMMGLGDGPSELLERHAAQAGESETIVHPQLMLEAEEAERRGALSEAVRLWQLAEQVAPDADSSCEALLLQVDTLVRQRRHGVARRLLIEGRQRLSSLGPSEVSHSKLRLRTLLVESLADPASVDPSETRVLIRDLRSAGLQKEFARAVDCALVVADFQEDHGWATDLLRTAEGSEGACPEARAWINLAKTRHLYLGNPEEGLHAARRAVVEAEGSSSTNTLSRALNRLIVALVFRGLLASREGHSTLKKARQLGRSTGDTLLIYDSFVNEGSWLMDIGELDAAEEAFTRARDLLGRAMSQQESLTTMVNRGELLVHRRQGAEAYQEFSAALRYAGDSGAGRHLCSAGLALAALELGRLSAAKEWVQEIASIGPSARFRGNLSLVALAKSRVAQAQGLRTLALDTLLDFGREMLFWMIPASLKLYLEAFKLSIRWSVELDRDEVAGVVDLAQRLQIPGNGQRLVSLRSQVLR